MYRTTLVKIHLNCSVLTNMYMTLLTHMVTVSTHVHLYTTKKHFVVDAADEHVSAVWDSDG